MLKNVIPKKKKELLPFDFEFDVDGMTYPFTISGYDQEDALRRLDRIIVIIRGDISDALGEADVEEEEDEEELVVTPVKTVTTTVPETPKKAGKKKAFVGFKAPPNPSTIHPNGIKTNPYNREANKLTRKGVKETVD